GGSITTATDIVVSLDWVSIGERKPEIEERIAKEVIEQVERKLFEGIEKMKSERGKVPVALVGGGSILVKKLRGASRIAKPTHHEVANAIGAAISQVSGEIDRIFSLEEKTREEVLEEAKERASEEAIEAGADPETLQTVSLEEIPLAYLPGAAVRVKVKAAGDLAL
ncbi:hydantoinase subunit beta, partial [candidate division MSBL1 archaeon SCGC-AAA259E22]